MNAQDGNVAMQSNCSSSTSMCRLTFGQPDAATVLLQTIKHTRCWPLQVCAAAADAGADSADPAGDDAAGGV